MKLHHKQLAGHTIATSKGALKVDADGHVEVEDKSLAEELQAVGFKAPFRKDPPKAEPVVAPTPASEPVSAPEDQKLGRGKAKP